MSQIKPPQAQPTPQVNMPVDISNPQDVQGLVAVIITTSVFILEGIAMFKGVDPMQILQLDIGILGSIVGFYFGVKSQQ